METAFTTHRLTRADVSLMKQLNGVFAVVLTFVLVLGRTDAERRG